MKQNDLNFVQCLDYTQKLNLQFDKIEIIRQTSVNSKNLQDIFEGNSIL